MGQVVAVLGRAVLALQAKASLRWKIVALGGNLNRRQFCFNFARNVAVVLRRVFRCMSQSEGKLKRQN